MGLSLLLNAGLRLSSGGEGVGSGVVRNADAVVGSCSPTGSADDGCFGGMDDIWTDFALHSSPVTREWPVAAS